MRCSARESWRRGLRRSWPSAFAAAGAYMFARRRLGGLPALAAALLLCLSFAYYYATEARAYALMLAATAVGFLSWRHAVESRQPRAIPLALFALSMAALVSTHYFAGLALAAFVAGEVRRALDTRRIDWPIAANTLPVSPCAGPLRSNDPRDQGGLPGFSWRTGELADMWRFYAGALAPAAIPVGLSAVAAVAIWAWEPGGASAQPRAPRRLRAL